MLGEPDCFSSPKRPVGGGWIDAKAPPESHPETGWRELLKGSSPLGNRPYREVATRLIAYLYRACATDAAVIVAVAPEAFRRGGNLARLVSFARTALPAELKRDCRIRINTNRPAVFLGEMKAHLVAIPEDASADALRSRPGASLVDLNAGHIHGPEIEGSHWMGYAAAVVEKFLDSPPRLFVPALYSFAAKVGPVAGFHANPDPDPRSLVTLETLYDLIAIENDPALTAKMLRYCFDRPETGMTRPWEALLPAGRLRGLEDSQIQELAELPARTPDATALLRQIFAEAEERRLRIRVSAASGADRILEQLERGLVDAGQAAELIRAKRSDEIFALLDPAQTTQLTRQRMGFAGLLARLDFGTGLPEAWQAELPRLGTAAEAADRLLDVCLANEKLLWLGVAFAALDRLLDAAILIPPSVVEKTSRLQGFPTARDWAVASEVQFRGRAGDPSAYIKRALAWDEPEPKRWVSANCEDPRWTFLKDFPDPPAWDEFCRDILLNSPKRLRRLMDTPSRIVSIASGSPSRSIPLAALEILDECVHSELSSISLALGSAGKAQAYLEAALKTTSALIDGGLWMKWRMATRLTPDDRSAAARGWLMDCRKGRPVLLEEWHQCVLDLGRPTGVEFAQLGNSALGGTFRWHLLPVAGRAQLRELCELCGDDFGALAEVAEATGGGGEIESVARARYPWLPEEFLSPFQQSGGARHDLTFLSRLWEKAGHRQAQVRNAVISAVFGHSNFLSDPEGVIRLAGNGLDLWNSEDFIRRLLEFTVKREPQRDFLSAVESRLRSCRVRVGLSNAPPQKLVEWYRNHGYPTIARLLSNSMFTDVLEAALASFRMQKPELEPCWGDMSVRVERRMLDPDPMSDFLEELTTGSEVFANEATATAFDQVLTRFSNLMYCNRGRVPAFEVFGFLHTNASLGKAASEFLKLARQCQGTHTQQWWDAFYTSMAYRVRGDGQCYFDDCVESALPRLTRAAIALPLNEGQLKQMHRSRLRLLLGPGAERFATGRAAGGATGGAAGGE
jgi:hypothetical protein